MKTLSIILTLFLMLVVSSGCFEKSSKFDSEETKKVLAEISKNCKGKINISVEIGYEPQKVVFQFEDIDKQAVLDGLDVKEMNKE